MKKIFGILCMVAFLVISTFAMGLNSVPDQSANWPPGQVQFLQMDAQVTVSADVTVAMDVGTQGTSQVKLYKNFPAWTESPGCIVSGIYMIDPVYFENEKSTMSGEPYAVSLEGIRKPYGSDSWNAGWIVNRFT